MKNILDSQYEYAFNIGKKYITSLKEKEGLFIIDKNMNIRVIFYYKENTYFISNSFNIPELEYINKHEPLVKLCEKISDKFEGTDYLRLSKLITNVDYIVNKYLINSFIILVNRIEHIVLSAKSLEIFNELLILDPSGFLLSVDNNLNYLVSDNIIIKNNIITNSGNINIEDLLKTIYKSEKYFPMTNNRSYELLEDIPDGSIFIFASVSAESLITMGNIQFINNIKYNYNDIYDIIKNICNILKFSDNIEEDISNEFKEFYKYYNIQYTSLLN